MSPRPTILGLRPSTLVRLYADRLIGQIGQELLAAAGIAVGVALLFGVMVANTSITSSASRLVHSIAGAASIQLAARSSDGFDERVAERAASLPAVKVAAALLREPATIVGPHGSQPVQLVGVTPEMIELRGEATRNLGEGALLLGSGIGLPSSVGEAIGAQAGEKVTVLVGGAAHTAKVGVVLNGATVGAVADSPIAVTMLPVTQRLSGMHGRVTEVLIEPKAHQQRIAEAQLRRLDGALKVEPVNSELRVLAQAAGPNSESTQLFAAISAMVGALIALNAVLLTVPERRRFVIELELQGYGPRQVLVVMASQACALGLIGSLAGIGLGYVLAHTLFQALPVYLTFAFPLSPHPIIELSTVLIALASGLVAALLASLAPLWDMRPSRSLDETLREPGEVGQKIGPRTIFWMAAAAAAIVVATTLLVLLVPQLSVIGGALLAVAAVTIIPAVCALGIRALGRLSEGIKGSMIAIAVDELAATAARSSVLAAVAALAVYGLIAVGGARSDLTHGLHQAIRQYLDTADVWVTPRGENVYTTDSFNAGTMPATIAHAPGVSSVRFYGGALLDVGQRRMWIRARSPGDPNVLQTSQMVAGDYATASRRIRDGGWAAISGGFAAERHLKVGDPFTLPTPAGRQRLRVAAITTNVGWPAGAITMSAADYRQWWRTSQPAAIEVILNPGVSPGAGRRAVQAAIGDRPGLQVQTARQRERQFRSVASQALSRLSEISILLLIAGALAVAAALSAVIWQRRPQLAELKAQGFTSAQLVRALLLESTVVIAVGCLAGAVLGVYGHALADRWLMVATGYPAPFSPGIAHLLATVALIAGIALAMIGLFGRAAARTSPYATLRE